MTTIPEIEVAHDGDAPVPDVEPLTDSSPPTSDATPPEPEAPRVAIVPIEVIQGVVTGGFAAVAARRGEHWNITDDEALNIAEPLSGELEDLARLVPFLDGAADALGSRRMRLLAAVVWTVTPRAVIDVMSRSAAPSDVTPIRPATPAQNDTPTRSGDELSTTDADTLARDLAGLPPRDGGA